MALQVMFFCSYITLLKSESWASDSHGLDSECVPTHCALTDSPEQTMQERSLPKNILGFAVL